MLENNVGNNDAIASGHAELQSIKDELVTDGVTPEKAEVIVQRVARQVITIRRGPLPSVEDFKGYESICSGAARDILNMAIDALAHRIDIEKATSRGDTFFNAINILAAILIISAVLSAVIYLALNGHDWVAGILASGTGVAAIMATFLKSKIKKDDE